LKIDLRFDKVTESLKGELSETQCRPKHVYS